MRTWLSGRYLKHAFRVMLLIIFFALAYWLYHWYLYDYVYTRDAYVYANVVNVASQLDGTVTKVYVKDNEFVKQGELLFVINQTPYNYKLIQARANLQHIESTLAGMKALAKSSQAALNEQLIDLKKAEDYLDRIQKLYKTNSVSFIEYNNAKNKVKILVQSVQAQREKLIFSKVKIDNSLEKQAKAAYKKALFDFNNTYIRSPVSGYITNFNILEGDYVQSGKPLFALVDTQTWWVIARFKETLVRLIHKGDKATISLSMYPGANFIGEVDSIGWGINRSQSSPDAAPSTLIYSSPTEDWVHISQRFPVRIKVKELEKYPFRIGASAHVQISN